MFLNNLFRFSCLPLGFELRYSEGTPTIRRKSYVTCNVFCASHHRHYRILGICYCGAAQETQKQEKILIVVSSLDKKTENLVGGFGFQN